MFEWTGRTDPHDGDAGTRWHHVMQHGSECPPDAVALLGLASDEGVRRNQGRPGAAEGPDALRRALCNLPVLEPINLIDLGDIECRDGDLESAQARYADVASQTEGLVIGLGGGHEIAWASYQALRLRKPDAKIGILNFDAHFDLRFEEQATSGTSFRAALEDNPGLTDYCVLGISDSSNTRALFEAADQLKVRYTRDEELTSLYLADALDEMEEWLRTIDDLYLTICLDVFPVATAPGVSAPASRGVSLEIVEWLVGQAVISGKLRIADIAELNPTYDIDSRTARLAARLVWRIARLWDSRRRVD